MSKKILIWIGVFIGSTIGGFVPELWGADMFSFSGLLFSTLGALFGIYLGFTFGE
ncbi:MAG: hypothetical protein Q7S16_02625 [bacterium]|nr:hypothetical protein [bacterium]